MKAEQHASNFLSFSLVCLLSSCNDNANYQNSTDSKNNIGGEEGLSEGKVSEVNEDNLGGEIVVNIEEGERYVMVSDYTSPSAKGHVPFCFFDLAGSGCNKLAIYISVKRTEQNSVITVKVKFFQDSEFLVERDYARSSVKELKFSFFNEVVTEKISSNTRILKQAEFGAYGQESIILTVVSKSLVEMKGHVSISSSYPFWDWNPERVSEIINSL